MTAFEVPVFNYYDASKGWLARKSTEGARSTPFRIGRVDFTDERNIYTICHAVLFTRFLLYVY